MGPVRGNKLFMFCNIHTNQVVYTLHHLAQRTVLKQLTYVGKNSVPTDFRRDMWLPMASIQFPAAEQGNSALRKLLEFRKMHDHCWETGDGPRLDKKQRRRELMDQKANSVADLAAVLKIQERTGEAARAKELELLNQGISQEERKWTQLEELSDAADNGEIDVLTIRIKDWRTRLEESESGKKAWITNQIENLRHRKQELQKAQEIIHKIKKIGGPKNSVFAIIQKIKTGVIKTSTNIPKFGNLRQYVISRNSANKITMEGVIIKWADLRDREYAQSWPEPVQHEAMGFARNVPPPLDKVALTDLSEVELEKMEQKRIRKEKKAMRAVEKKTRKEEKKRNLLEKREERIQKRLKKERALKELKTGEPVWSEQSLRAN